MFDMQNSTISSYGHSVWKWPIISGGGIVLMLFLVMPLPTYASGCKILCNAWGMVGSWVDNIMSPPAVKQRGRWSRGVLRVPLLAQNPILQAGKEVVYLGWMGCEKTISFQVNVTGNGKTWATSTTSAFVAIKEADFKFEADNDYEVQISCSGQQIQSYTLEVVNNILDYLPNGKEKELNERLRESSSSLETQAAVRATWWASQGRQYMLEAYQQIADITELQVIKVGLESGTRPPQE